MSAPIHIRGHYLNNTLQTSIISFSIGVLMLFIIVLSIRLNLGIFYVGPSFLLLVTSILIFLWTINYCIISRGSSQEIL